MVRVTGLLLVLLYHFFKTAFPGGFIGVDIFFTFSGYLITALLIDEYSKNKKIEVLVGIDMGGVDKGLVAGVSLPLYTGTAATDTREEEGIAVNPLDLRTTREVVLVAGGWHKVKAIRAAMKLLRPSVLIVNEIVADQLAFMET